MKIGVISDTHDQISQIEKAVAVFNQEKVGLVIHCGDWVAPFSVIPFQKLTCPLKGIFGNNDGDKFRHAIRMKSRGIDLFYEERFLVLNVEGRNIAVFHGDYQEIVDALVTCGTYDVVFHGHTHINVNQTIGKTLSLNPGTLMKYTLPGVEGASFAVYDSKPNTARIIEL